ncbi:hypothetical protein OGAPHI_006561 [Ogataea philodendri]|nr:uncharacterized protein OGAPHI_006561 [Ogataea philodendri]KAH3661459.1 hypothetical protein OGAPHI_006561 [Ogataea philodendri]
MSEQAASSQRPSGERTNLKDAIGNMLRTDSQWFQNFDEQVLKPVFLDSTSSPMTNRDEGLNSNRDSPRFMSSRK